jgi:hypothetical protein
MTCTLWSTADKLPCQGAVLVWNGEDFLIAFRIGQTWYEAVTGQIANGVTHWTPLPEPPTQHTD